MKNYQQQQIIQPIPSPIDLTLAQDAHEWAMTANSKRPWRYDFFHAYMNEIKKLNLTQPTVLELGSGPGHCAKILLSNLEDIHYTALDFSSAMHQLSQDHLGELSQRINYLVSDFRIADWYKNLAEKKFDVVIIHQALHELRHKSYASTLHTQVKNHALNPNGVYFVTDHLYTPQSMKNNQLFMSHAEHITALKSAHFSNIRHMFEIQNLCFFKCSLNKKNTTTH